jgi:predicted PurR-regulated permease PerM
MARLVSFVLLLVILLFIGALFLQVMAQFLLPLFLAVLLVVVFQPVHDRVCEKLKGRQRVAAGLTTLLIVAAVLLPLAGILVQAAGEAVTIYQAYAHSAQAKDEAVGSDPPESAAKRLLSPAELAKFIVVVGKKARLTLSEEEVAATIREKAAPLLAPITLRSARFTGGLLMGFVIMIIGIYYFLADGPTMIHKLMQLLPLENEYEHQLIDEFARVSRAVVLASLLSAAAQGVLAGIGYYFAGLGAVFFLTLLTMLLALVPFVGAAAVWLPASLWLYFGEGRLGAAIALAIYGVVVISMADNIIKPMVLHGRSSIHPLLALLSVLGGVQALGPIGIFVGPMVVAFLYALLNMFNRELERMNELGIIPKWRPAEGRRL